MGTMEDVAEAQTSEQVQTAFVGATERWKARELKVSLAGVVSPVGPTL
uniref:Uncharacterized protein n=1 Tax=Ipomoea trifida TaxID=35884 RepID=A0A950_IPOTF|nr:hypothetical protein [Ipomoea trifida]